MGKYLVAIDAGHGINTAGKRSVKLSSDLYIDGVLIRKKGQTIKEYEWNKAVSEYLAAALKRCGINTMYTADMTGKTDIPLNSRANTANKKVPKTKEIKLNKIFFPFVIDSPPTFMWLLPQYNFSKSLSPIKILCLQVILYIKNSFTLMYLQLNQS